MQYLMLIGGFVGLFKCLISLLTHTLVGKLDRMAGSHSSVRTSDIPGQPASQPASQVHGGDDQPVPVAGAESGRPRTVCVRLERSVYSRPAAVRTAEWTCTAGDPPAGRCTGGSGALPPRDMSLPRRDTAQPPCRWSALCETRSASPPR